MSCKDENVGCSAEPTQLNKPTTRKPYRAPKFAVLRAEAAKKQLLAAALPGESPAVEKMLASISKSVQTAETETRSRKAS
jgi:hypothetical protein